MGLVTACSDATCPANTTEIGDRCILNETDAGRAGDSSMRSQSQRGESAPPAASTARSTPSPEQCPDGRPRGDEECDGEDNDCDGRIDESLAPRPCGPTMKLGTCAPGEETCRDGAWSACEGAIEPADETCDSEALDEDCDGIANPGCACSGSEERPCGVDIGACISGRSSCEDGRWSTRCVGATMPTAETCDRADNDCDGVSDESPTDCESPMICTNGRCVQCMSPVQCPAASDCSAAQCTASGTCVNAPKRRGEPCGSGVCDGEGSCVACVVHSDCPDAFDLCQDNRCTPGPGCGNGRLDPGERCDPQLAGWNSATCDPQTCRTLVYAACDFDTQGPCPTGWFCGPHEGCTRNCTRTDECAFPGFPGACLKFENTDPNASDFWDCALECPMSCPNGTRCVTWDTHTICGQNTFPPS